MTTTNTKLAFKILPILAVTALLAACNTTGGVESANLSAQTFSHQTSPSSNGYGLTSGGSQARTAASQSN